jgi:hypothetical protein
MFSPVVVVRSRVDSIIDILGDGTTGDDDVDDEEEAGEDDNGRVRRILELWAGMRASARFGVRADATPIRLRRDLIVIVLFSYGRTDVDVRMGIMTLAMLINSRAGVFTTVHRLPNKTYHENIKTGEERRHACFLIPSC